jgi:hypothetical protein
MAKLDLDLVVAKVTAQFEIVCSDETKTSKSLLSIRRRAARPDPKT